MSASDPQTTDGQPPTDPALRFLRIRLRAPSSRFADLAHFYRGHLGFEPGPDDPVLFTCTVGETTLEFLPSTGEPFYHFALLVPGDRFPEAHRWAEERTELLAHRDSGKQIFKFDSWDARACYFHDPAGNIVELIAHRGLGERSTRGPFRAAELIGFSELGIVGQPSPMAELLREQLGLRVWSGSATDPGGLAFVGEKARTLILSSPGRGWLPTGRQAEIHDLEAVLSGPPDRETHLEQAHYMISRGS